MTLIANTDHMQQHEPFDQAFQEFAIFKGIALQRLRVVYNKRRVFAASTPHSHKIFAEAAFGNGQLLRSCPCIERIIEAMLDLDFEEWQMSQTQNAQARIQQHGKQDQLQQGSNPTDSPSNADGALGFEEAQAQSDDEDTSSKKMILTLRSKNYSDTKVSVEPTTRIRKILQSFLKGHHLDAKALIGEGKVTMEFDGDILDLDDTVENADIDDEEYVFRWLSGWRHLTWSISCLTIDFCEDS